ncbi:MAG: type VI secretion system tip protein VgrG [Methylococcaceae bacterium]|jgi:type VI secretion system secreted protein VgrG
MTYSQIDRVASVSAPAISDNLLLYRLSGFEQLSRLFEYELEFLAENASLNLKSLLGSNLTIKLAWADADPRYFNGIVTRVSQIGKQDELYAYRALIQPALWLLTRASNCKIMPTHKTVPEIINAVLSSHGYSDVIDRLSATYEAREYCVQYRESDFNFISRLMEEEGIYYFFEHRDGSHQLVLCDDISAHNNMPGDATIDYSPASSGGGHGSQYISDWCLNQAIRAGIYTLKDYDFTAPTADLTKTNRATTAHPQANSKEFYDYPGGYSQSSDGSRYAQIRMQEQMAEFERIQAQGNVQNLALGNKFSLAAYPREDQNREYLVIATQVQLQNNDYASGVSEAAPDYRCGYEVISSEAVFRPSRVTPRPVVQGVQTAIVVGNSSDEICTDEYGRVKVQFHWDRDGQNDQNSSCWIRVAQIWAGKGWGGIYIPRVGQEVIVDFLEGNPDRPIIIGSVYNADQIVPYSLPDNKSQSGIKTRSTSNGSSDNFNQIQFEDKKDAEAINLQAEKDFNLLIKNNDKQTIGSNQSVDGSQTIDIFNHRTVTLDQGNDQLTLKQGKRAVLIKQGDDSLDISQGNRTTSLGQGNDELTLNTGNRTVNLKQGNDELTLNTGNRTVNLKQGNDNLTLTAGNLNIKAQAGAISQEAMQSLTLTVGQNSITIDQQGVTIKGLMVTIQGQAQAELKSPMTTVSGDGMLTVKGGVVMIN